MIAINNDIEPDLLIKSVYNQETDNNTGPEVIEAYAMWNFVPIFIVSHAT